MVWMAKKETLVDPDWGEHLEERVNQDWADFLDQRETVAYPDQGVPKEKWASWVSLGNQEEMEETDFLVELGLRVILAKTAYLGGPDFLV